MRNRFYLNFYEILCILPLVISSYPGNFRTKQDGCGYRCFRR